MTSIFRFNSENLTVSIEMELYKKQKYFSKLFSQFFKFRLIFERFKKYIYINLIAHVLSKVRTRKGVVRQMSKKFLFRSRLNKQHGKWSQTLLKSARQHFYHIC